MELAAFHLHRMGAAHARQVMFLADGTDWIWDRVPEVVKQVELEKRRCHDALDVSHAVNHIALALEARRSSPRNAIRRIRLSARIFHRFRHYSRAGPSFPCASTAVTA
jgi:hypothetical protein